MLYDVDGALTAGKAQVAQEVFRLNLLLVATALAILIAAVLVVDLLADQARYVFKEHEQPAAAAQLIVTR